MRLREQAARVYLLTFLVILLPNICFGGAGYFPDGSLSKIEGMHQSLNEYFSGYLTKLGEKNLPDNNGEIYRFLWLRTFDQPVVFIVDVRKKSLKMKSLEKSKAGKVGGISRNENVPVSRKMLKEFLFLAEKHFWPKVYTKEKFDCLDGAMWLIEGYKDRKYNAQIVHCPNDNADTVIVGKKIIELSGVKFKNIY